VKARSVRGLDPKGTLADNLERIVRVRADELEAFVPRALDARKVNALHDMRIAAKRLRYILELGSPALGPYAETAAKRAKALQDLLGEIHDCDVTLPRVLALIDRTREADAYEVRRRAGDAEDLDPALAAGAPSADIWRGLEALAIHLEARRALLFERFLEMWEQLGREGFRARLDFAIGERPGPPTSSSPVDDNDRVASVSDTP
jgi:CHAD domain